jgi:L-2,4-diaminobutyrate decarboxylase
LEAYLRESQAGAPPLRWKHPTDLIDLAARALQVGASEPDAGFGELARLFLSEGHRLHSPHYMGHQVAVPIPAAGLFEVLGGFTNQGGAVYEMAPLATAIERVMVQRLSGLIGGPPGTFDGFATHGGSLANLTALVTARNLRYPGLWEAGVVALDRRPAILVSRDSHYSVARAAGILGLGSRQVIPVPLDDRRRMRAGAASEALAGARANGLDVFAIVAASGSTPVGAFDPLDELADLAAREGLWLHVDGCHGASVLVSHRHRHRHLVAGVERADSLAWDAHKMLFVPALSTYLFYRNPAHSFATFSQDAPYLFDPEAPGLSAFDGAIRTVECTKRALSIGLWAAWTLHGEALFRDLVDVTLGLGRMFYELLREQPDFAPVHEPQANILCFRHLPERLRGATTESISAFQQALRRRLVEKGHYYITSTRLDGNMVLRVTLMHPLTERRHLEGLLAELRELGRDLAG